MLKERMQAAQDRLKELQAKVADASETAQIAAMLKKDELDERIANAKGELAAAKDKARKSSEKAQSKMNSSLLKAQMTINAAKEELNAKVEAKDKASRKNHIEDLVSYSEQCEALAAQLLVESDLALLQAAAEAADYVATYGEDA